MSMFSTVAFRVKLVLPSGSHVQESDEQAPSKNRLRRFSFSASEPLLTAFMQSAPSGAEPGLMICRHGSNGHLWQPLPPALACRYVPTRRRFGGLPCFGHGLSTPDMGIYPTETSHVTQSWLPQKLLTIGICYPRPRLLNKDQAKTIHGCDDGFPSAIGVLSTTPETFTAR